MGKNFCIATVSLLLLLTSTNAGQVFDVKSYGAQTNGDITQVKICVVQLTILD